jgi:hypothetical protein
VGFSWGVRFTIDGGVGFAGWLNGKRGLGAI